MLRGAISGRDDHLRHLSVMLSDWVSPEGMEASRDLRSVSRSSSPFLATDPGHEAPAGRGRLFGTLPRGPRSADPGHDHLGRGRVAGRRGALELAPNRARRPLQGPSQALHARRGPDRSQGRCTLETRRPGGTGRPFPLPRRRGGAPPSSGDGRAVSEGGSHEGSPGGPRPALAQYGGEIAYPVGMGASEAARQGS